MADPPRSAHGSLGALAANPPKLTPRKNAVLALTYGCFSGPSLLATQFHEFQLHAKVIAVGSGVLLAAVFALARFTPHRKASAAPAE